MLVDPRFTGSHNSDLAQAETVEICATSESHTVDATWRHIYMTLKYQHVTHLVVCGPVPA